MKNKSQNIKDFSKEIGQPNPYQITIQKVFKKYHYFKEMGLTIHP